MKSSASCILSAMEFATSKSETESSYLELFLMKVLKRKSILLEVLDSAALRELTSSMGAKLDLSEYHSRLTIASFCKKEQNMSWTMLHYPIFIQPPTGLWIAPAFNSETWLQYSEPVPILSIFEKP